jgi:hypothetical protein
LLYFVARRGIPHRRPTSGQRRSHTARREAQRNTIRNAEVLPARRFGMKTALFVGDKVSLQLSPDQLKAALKEPANRPDVLLTELGQLADVLPS